MWEEEWEVVWEAVWEEEWVVVCGERGLCCMSGCLWGTCAVLYVEL